MTTANLHARLSRCESLLRELKDDGVSHVYLSDETLRSWKKMLEQARSLGRGLGSQADATVEPEETEAERQARLSNLRQLTGNGEKIDLVAFTKAVEKKTLQPRAQPGGDFAIKPIPEPEPFTLPDGDKAARWAWLRKRVLDCPVCREHVQGDNQVVFGTGSLDADIFFCGEAPGQEESIQGEPFVGPAGKLLNKIIAAMGLERESVYIGNIMNWRPEMPTTYGNRKPTLEEMHFCLPYLKAQLDIVQPKVIVALGGTAVDGLLGPDPKRRVSSVRGKWHDYRGMPLMVTFHPSYLLQNGTMAKKRLVWEDMLQVMEKIGLPISEKQRGYFL